MKRFTMKLAALLTVVCMLTACKEETKPTETPAAVTETPSVTEEVTPEVTATPTPTGSKHGAEWDEKTLKDRYADSFKFGVALPSSTFRNEIHMKVVKEQFNSFTFENEMKPDALLNRDATQKGYPDTNTEPVLNFAGIKKGLDFAKENGFGVRGHTLCWYSQTPKWFFTVDYQSGSPLCSREVMLARLESYIKQVMTFCQEEYPGVIYAWDVVNEAVDIRTGDANGVRKEKNNWYETIGPDFINYAFLYARKYSDGTAGLYYNDYGCEGKKQDIVRILAPVKEAGNIDGIGMQCHLSTGDNMRNAVYRTAKFFTEAGYKVQITELDIGTSLKGERADLIQAMKYKALFQLVEEADKNGEIDIDSVTVWGLHDTASWRSGENPLLFRIVGTITKKEAWYGAMQVPDIAAME